MQNFPAGVQVSKSEITVVQWESLVNLANHAWFAKLKPSKLINNWNTHVTQLVQISFKASSCNSSFAKLQRSLLGYFSKSCHNTMAKKIAQPSGSNLAAW